MKKKAERKITIKISAEERRTPGNPVAQNPLLRKGGAHVRAKSAERFDGKQQTRKAAREWERSRGAVYISYCLLGFLNIFPCPGIIQSAIS